MLTKGDVLAYLGEIPSARGSEKAEEKHPVPEVGVLRMESIVSTLIHHIRLSQAKKEAPKKPLVEMDGETFRRLIAVGLGSPTSAPRALKSAPVSLGPFCLFTSCVSDR